MFDILVVDDDKYARMLLKAVLESENYTVHTAQNGAEALDVMEKQHIDLVVLDIMMPEMDGYEFTQLVRENSDNIPIFMISAKQLPSDKKRGFAVGIDDYMTKPIDEEELLWRIKALLRRSKIVNEQKIVMGNVILDYQSLNIRRGEEVVEVPKKEFLILYKLLSYPGRIFTRIELMNEFWGMDSESGLETVTVHIGRLRKRFENWEEFEIESVRGLGYKAVKKI